MKSVNTFVMIRHYPCLWFAILLVSCDKPQEAGNSSSTRDPKPRATRTERPRPPRDQAPSPSQNLHASLKAAKKVESLEARDKALAETAWSAAGLDLDIIAKAIEQISTDSEEKIPLIEFYAQQLAEQDPDEALAWAAKLGSEKEITAAKQQIILALADSDPQRAANLIPPPGTAGREMDGSALHVLQRLTAKSPAAAATWVSSFPSGDARKTAVKALVSDWTQIDSQAAFAWLASLNDPIMRSDATSAIMDAFVDQVPEIRAQWLEQTDPKIRTELERLAGQLPEEVEESILPQSE